MGSAECPQSRCSQVNLHWKGGLIPESQRLNMIRFMRDLRIDLPLYKVRENLYTTPEFNDSLYTSHMNTPSIKIAL